MYVVKEPIEGDFAADHHGNEPEYIVGRCDVEVLDTVGGDSFVRGTLQPGDQIVASGTQRIVLGQRVIVQNESLAQNDQ